MNFAIIPDIHASIDRLTKSLKIAPSHQLIFLGDLIDGGANPGKCDDLSVLETVKALVDCGRARVVMGNHELNAIMFHRRSNEYNLPFRPHKAGNLQQHKSFIDTFGIETEDALYWTGWMLENFPLWIEYDEFRIVHACWSSRAIDIIKARRPDGFLKFEDLYEIACGETPFAKAVEMLTSGLKYAFPMGIVFETDMVLNVMTSGLRGGTVIVLFGGALLYLYRTYPNFQRGNYLQKPSVRFMQKKRFPYLLGTIK